MKPEDRIDLLRRRHVEAAKAGLAGRINLRRIMHVEVAQGEERMRKKGIKLHVIQNTTKTNYCPFLKRDMPLIVCLCRSVNYTERVCFGCERPMEWARGGGHLKDHDARMRPRDYQPTTMGKYVDGALTNVTQDPYAYLRVELPSGDVLWFKRYADGLVEPDYGARPNNEEPGRWWQPGPNDMAPLNSTLDEEDLKARLDAAERERTRLYRGAEPKETKKRKAKDEDEE